MATPAVAPQPQLEVGVVHTDAAVLRFRGVRHHVAHEGEKGTDRGDELVHARH